MSQAFGGLTITGNTTQSVPQAAGSEFNPSGAWAALGASKHGEGAISASPSTGRLTMAPGTYRVCCNMTIQGEADDESGFSGDVAGTVTLQLHRGGTLWAGSKCKTVVASGVVQPLYTEAIIEITQALKDAGTNYVSAFIATTDASGNEILVSECQLLAYKLN